MTEIDGDRGTNEGEMVRTKAAFCVVLVMPAVAWNASERPKGRRLMDE
jgi:hypothetical protein